MKSLDKIKFDSNGLVPAIVQDVKDNQVLMMAYMNRESLQLTIDTGKTHFYSRSRNRLWQKGETSGHYQLVRSVNYDCDGDTILVKVEQIGGACHTGRYSCFHNRLVEKTEIGDDTPAFSPDSSSSDREYNQLGAVLTELYDVVKDRRENPKEGSYTNYLLDKGLDKILKKVGEESAETIIASKNRDKEEIIYEVSDLLYHLIVLLVDRGVVLEDIAAELKKRR